MIQLCYDRTDKADTKGGQQAVHGALLALFDTGLQVFHALFAIAFKRANIIPWQVINVGKIVDTALAHEQLGLLMPKLSTSIAPRETKYSTERTNWRGQVLSEQ